MSKLPARRIGRSRETQKKQFDQAGSKLGNTIFENTRKVIIRVPMIKAREGMGKVIMHNFRNEALRGWKSRRNMPDIIQSRVGSKCLSKEFSFSERRDSSGAIRLKKIRKDENVKLLEILKARCQK